ncbi:GyrI-like domain-containing protein [Lederbergia wuyishanensis]|uniref:GyrI-like small molecule binding domain-containing protein n=1 Tax=Lederbergia wuyishanensis TaxID=1347903 RepID=A0ABU0D837_9BACI|nr:GyrI-like domain-containing protein [Lederbergia wuyishanensis]MCJ8009318.1 GyrI-like domain-containing protein [Lederbergia wuyishanensis]MDQ0344548.1 hypothetical protein [Lederbergia wuyishanensis]
MTQLKPKTLKTHDHRKIYRDIYQLKPDKTVIQLLPELKYVSQSMITSYHMNWDGRPEPIDEKWIAWKVVNQIKQITKKELEYKFKLMPPEIIWHRAADNKKWIVDQMMLVADCVTDEMFERAMERVKKNLRVKELPTITFKKTNPTLCAQRLHVGHYKHAKETLQKIKEDLEAEGYQVNGAHREIYLYPAMDCYPPEKCKTIVSVEIEKRSN